MRHVQAERLDHAGCARLQFARHGLERILRKQLSGALQRRDLIIAFRAIALGNFGIAGVFFADGGEHLRPVVIFKQGNNIAGDVVHHMNAAGADVHNDVVSQKLKLMNHIVSRSPNCRVVSQHT